jgi:hypothetical protein
MSRFTPAFSARMPAHSATERAENVVGSESVADRPMNGLNGCSHREGG